MNRDAALAMGGKFLICLGFGLTVGAWAGDGTAGSVAFAGALLVDTWVTTLARRGK